jgi:hypothetical protein
MVATIAYSLADLFGHPSVGGNIYLQDLKACPDIMIITVFLIHSSFVAPRTPLEVKYRACVARPRSTF